MASRSAEALLAAEALLDRSFAACVVAFLVQALAPVYFRLTGQEAAAWTVPILSVLVICFLGTYIWFAFAASAAAKHLGKSRALYLVWFIGAPVLALAFAIPVISHIIAASPLSLKFLLSGQLRSEIHDRTFEE